MAPNVGRIACAGFPRRGQKICLKAEWASLHLPGTRS
jgi:hypothetical protein